MTMNYLLAAMLISAGPNIQTFTMPDGLDVVIHRVPGADQVALRLIVRAGASHDPGARNGLAHAVQQLVFHGSYAIDSSALRAHLLERGANYGAVTSIDYTYYVLDVSKTDWLPASADYLEVVTNPALMDANLDAALGVIESKEASLFFEKSLFWAADLVLFPSRDNGRTPIIGSRTTRRSITSKNVLEFYRKYYIPTNATILIVGDVPLSEIEVLLSDHVRWPPHTLRERIPLREPVDMNVPVNQTIRAYPPAVLYGYAVPELDGGTCRAIANLLQLRLTIDLVGKKALATSVLVDCPRLRGRQILMTATLSRSNEGGLAPSAVAEAFEGVRSTQATTRERSAILRRMALRSKMSVREKAERLIPALAAPPSKARTRRLEAIVDPPPFRAVQIRRAARRAFVPNRRIVLRLDPLR